MAIKYTILGLLIYLAIAEYILAFLLTVAGNKKTGRIIYRMGFTVAAAAFAFRWYEVGRPEVRRPEWCFIPWLSCWVEKVKVPEIIT